jgi:pimeloyl-ACP methyl ester carboxylesterase
LKENITPYAFIRRTLIVSARVLLFSIATILGMLLILDRFVEFRENDDDLGAFFKKKHIPATIGYYSSNGRDLRYLTVGNENAPASIVFIHGAPSSMSYFKPYFSNESLESQAKMIRPLLDSLRQVHHPLIIVAASYGTTVACRLAMDYPGLIDGLVLVAPSLAPGEEKIYPIGYIGRNPLVKWAVPRMLVSANAEKFSHRQELEKMLPNWKNIKVPVIYLQGKNDGLIYPSNAVFARKKLVNASSLDIYMIPGRGHLIAFLEIKKITAAINEMLQLSKKFYLAKETVPHAGSKEASSTSTLR